MPAESDAGMVSQAYGGGTISHRGIETITKRIDLWEEIRYNK